jgi:ElaB/YqjD/DUF883 family membrane-anchored ribosome-binding protein
MQEYGNLFIPDGHVSLHHYSLPHIPSRARALSPRHQENTLKNLTDFVALLVSPPHDSATNAVWGLNNLYMDETHSQDRVQSAKEHLKGAVDDLHSASKAKAAQFHNVVEDTWSDAQSRAQTWQTEIGAYIQQNPTKAVFMALGVGFVLSRRLWK